MATVDQGVIPRVLSLQTPGKINLTLEILGRRSDGYHDLRSVVAGVDLRDEVRAVRREDRAFTIDCDHPGISADDNLARSAAQALAERYGVRCGVHLTVHKRIPVGAGLGGGSSDAFAALRLCRELWDLEEDDTTLAQIGAAVGSDVPVFFALPTAVMTGRGERVAPRPLRWRGWVLLILPGLSMATRDVYAAWRGGEGSGDRPLPDDIAACTRAVELSALLFNDLTEAAFHVCPALRDLKQTIELRLGERVHLTGSGSTLFQLFDDEQRALAAAKMIQQACPGVTTMAAPAPAAPAAPGRPRIEEL